MNKPLVWHSSFASFTGYSGSSLAFVLGLDQRGIPVRPLYLYGADHDEQIAAGRMHPRIKALQEQPLMINAPQVVYAPGDRFSKNSGSYRIGYTMLECDRLPAQWVEQANQLDEIWTPSAWGVQVFQESGVTRPIYMIPLGVDPAVYHPITQDLTETRLHDRTTFLSIFEWGPRKGWEILLKAYQAAFQPDDPVLLLLKIDCRAPANPISVIAELLHDSAPPIGLIYNQPLSTTRMAELYRSADCFVLSSHGEGWGMPILEAMACGVPAIATNWSAATLFLNEDNGYPLPIRGLIPADPTNRYTNGAYWADPDPTALVELLRRVANNPYERKQRGERAAITARSWTWQQALDRVVERLHKL